VTSRAAAEDLDRADPLAPFRERFLLPPGVLYLDGNSLGALARGVRERVDRVVAEEWATHLIGGWSDCGWMELPRRVAGRLAAFLGVEADEVAVADSTSVNLFKLLGAVLAARPGRRRLLAPEGNFPSDLYVAAGLAELCGAELVIVPGADLAAAVDDRTAAVTLSHVDFRTGELYDLAALAAAARAQGALVVADLAHSAGAMPLALAEWGVDLAVGCGYKFLGGGPGAPAFLVVRRSWQAALESPLRGWLGHADPFAFAEDWQPASGIGRFHCGTPPVLSLAALDAALDAWQGVDLELARAKAGGLGDLLIALAERELADLGVSVASPRDALLRGAQVSLRHPEAFAVMSALVARGIVGDFRAPDLLRFGLHPLTVRHVDVWDAMAGLAEVLRNGIAGAGTRPRPGMVT
jgi:kynureninase